MACDKQYHREYYLKHREKKLRYAEEYREKNKELIKEYWKNMPIEDKQGHAKRLRELYAKKIQEYKTLLGGKCVICGVTENLEFDHIDPKTKSFNPTRYVTGGKPKDLIIEEFKKCQLLCYQCHKNKTYNRD